MIFVMSSRHMTSNGERGREGGMELQQQGREIAGRMSHGLVIQWRKLETAY